MDLVAGKRAACGPREVGAVTMSDRTKIEWADATWNPITGCSVASPGCTNCYAMRLAGTRLKHHPSRAGLTTMTKAGPVWTGEVRFNESVIDQPLRWTRPRRIFVCAHGDLLHGRVPALWIERVADVMRRSPQHQFLVLTKRADLVHELAPGTNIWLGVSAEDQERADDRIPKLVTALAAVRWVSVEPMLGPVDLCFTTHLDWVVVGGESGPNARPCQVEWIRSVVQQCQAARVPVFVKQLGANCNIPLRHQKGADPSEWPADLRVRQWPAP